MKVVILCGGKGTRIRGVDDDLPKPLIPVRSYPILWHIMQSYAHFNHKDFVLCLGYKGEYIKNFFLNYRAMVSDFTIDFSKDHQIKFDKAHEQIDWKVSLAETGQETLTGSRIKKIERFIGNDDHFMLTYGDGVCDVDINELIAFHKDHGGISTVNGVRPPGRFREMEHDGSGKIIEFNEKPQASGGHISGGFFVCNREIFKYFDSKRDDETLEADPMRKLARDGQMIMFCHDGFWQCMDTYRDFAFLNELVNENKAPWVK